MESEIPGKTPGDWESAYDTTSAHYTGEKNKNFVISLWDSLQLYKSLVLYLTKTHLLESYYYRKTGPFTLFSGNILFFFRYPIIFRTNFVIFCVCQSSTHPGCIVLSPMTDSLPRTWIPLRGQQGGLLRITWMKKIFLPHWADHYRPWGQCTIAMLSHWKAREFILSWGNESLVSQHVTPFLFNPVHCLIFFSWNEYWIATWFVCFLLN